MANAVNWFEIPAKDYNRAVKFYSTIMGTKLSHMEMEGQKMAMFPMGKKDVAGAIVHGKGYTPSTKGSLVYLNGGDDLKKVLSKVSKAGGKVVLPKTSIGPNGFIAHFIDSEGNKVALHSMK